MTHLIQPVRHAALPPRGIVPLAWRMSLRLLGWIGLTSAAGLIVLLLLTETTGAQLPWSDRGRVIETIIPLILGLQAALLFAPDDEPALEILLACPRPPMWLALERVLLAAVCYTLVTLACIVVSVVLLPDIDLPLALLRWIPPSLFMMGVGLYVTIRSRSAALGVALSALLWFVTSFIPTAFIPGNPTLWPLDQLQPFLWLVAPFTQPEMLSGSDYWINRVGVSIVGALFIALALWQMRDTEWLLLAKHGIKTQKKGQR